jgi:hypothetical protein
MKNLQDFRLLVEEDKTDYSKFDMLVRAGLANKAQLARIHRILDKMTEERPQFNNADREIMRNLFNRMVDLVANNKQIFQKTRQAVREETDVESIEAETLDESNALTGDPPFVLVLKRKAIRYYPNESKVALYYNQKLDKYFSVPYGAGVEGPVQAEETQVEIVEAVIDQLHDIVKNKQATKVKFGNGKSVMVDGYTASAITQVHKSLNDVNKKKIADMVHKSPEHLKRVAEFAFSKVK